MKFRAHRWLYNLSGSVENVTWIWLVDEAAASVTRKARLFVKYLAIINKENLPNCLKKLLNWVQNYDKLTLTKNCERFKNSRNWEILPNLVTLAAVYFSLIFCFNGTIYFISRKKINDFWIDDLSFSLFEWDLKCEYSSRQCFF